MHWWRASLVALELLEHILLLLLHFFLKPCTQSLLFMDLFDQLNIFCALLEHGFLKFRISNLLPFSLFAENLLFGFFAYVLVLFKVFPKEPFRLLLVWRPFVSVSEGCGNLWWWLNFVLGQLFGLKLFHLLLHRLSQLWLLLYLLLRCLHFLDNNRSSFCLLHLHLLLSFFLHRRLHQRSRLRLILYRLFVQLFDMVQVLL